MTLARLGMSGLELFRPGMGGLIPVPPDKPMLQELFEAGDTGFWFNAEADDPGRANLDGSGGTVVADRAAMKYLVDQSGSGNHVVATSDAAAGTLMHYGDERFLRLPLNNSYLLPATFNADRRNFTRITVLAQKAQGQIRSLVHTPASAAHSIADYLASVSGNDTPQVYTYNNQPGTLYIPQGQLIVWVTVYRATGRKHFVGKMESAVLAALAAGATQGGFTLGGWDIATGFRAGNMVVKQHALIQRALTDPEIYDLIDDVSARCGALARSASTLIVYEGTSLIQGVGVFGASAGNPDGDAGDTLELVAAAPAQLSRLMNCMVHNMGDGGGKINPTGGWASAGNLTLINNAFARHAAAFDRLIFISDGPTNDIQSDGATLPQLQGYYQTLYDGITTPVGGKPVEKWVQTCLKRGEFGSTNGYTNPVQLAYNDWIRSGASPFGQNFIDTAADPILGDNTNQQYFTPDLTHIRIAGYAHQAQITAARLAA